ncbi:trypsin-like serine peptidase [Kitasatospora sp. NPDC096147]|uniref:trypsin-like serine peptidase n=1 Tax=Kitasatospora sp. NPDC096147 TaxID=3364093 RepID=UPI00382786A6
MARAGWLAAPATRRTVRPAHRPAALVAATATGLALTIAVVGCTPGAAQDAAPGTGPAGVTTDGFPSARTAPASAAADRIGTLFVGGPDGARSCTASVVSSPGRSLLVTAAHCVESRFFGRAGQLEFAPGYRNGRLPHGSWLVERMTVPTAWSEEADPEYDVAFLTVGELDGRRIEEVLGGFPLGTDRGFGLPVTVTGYPMAAEEPITCANTTAEQSPTQERFDCHGYTDGTSGSPWLTEAGEVVGVVGGHEEGGDTERTSYSITFDRRVAELYRQAVTG